MLSRRFFQETGREGGLKSSKNMTAEARGLRGQHARLTAVVREEQELVKIARELAKRPELVTFADLLRYRDVQQAAMEAGYLTRELYRKRIRRATKRFNKEYRGPQQ